ncbi:DUF397 domain-containing protein [Streptomyces sp. 4N509B]|uniref:DUF397 domain-containing protein n=1 Tax=Streptomyces sp. 4N509B TaxID=3457413 RepID=UPI003FD46E78
MKSSFSGTGGNNCVEVRALDGGAIAIREGEAPGSVLTADRARFTALLAAVRTGRLVRLTG